MDRVKVKDLVAGKDFIVSGEVKKKNARTKGGTGDPYISLRITDNTGTVYLNVWNNLPIYSEVEKLQDGQWIEATITCTKVDRFINGDLKSFTIVERKVEAPVDIEALTEDLRGTISMIKDPVLKKLVTNVFRREDINKEFFSAPATLMSGYSFDGGLLAHVVRLTHLARQVAKVYNDWVYNSDHVTARLNEDLLIAGCILHDVGKVRAFRKSEFKLDKTMEGELFEDSYITMKIINEEMDKLEISADKRMFIEHLIGSAKGKQSYGALHIPRTKEAVVFHFIDALDSQIGNFEFLERRAEDGDEFVQLFQKTFYLGDFE